MNTAIEFNGRRVELAQKLELELSRVNCPPAAAIPEKLEEGKFFPFDVPGWCLFPFDETIGLYVRGDQKQLALIEITSQTAYLLGGHVSTKGEYYVKWLIK